MPGPVSPAIPRAAAQGCCVRSTGSCPRPALGALHCPCSQVPGGGEAVSSASPRPSKPCSVPQPPRPRPSLVQRELLEPSGAVPMATKALWNECLHCPAPPCGAFPGLEPCPLPPRHAAAPHQSVPRCPHSALWPVLLEGPSVSPALGLFFLLLLGCAVQFLGPRFPTQGLKPGHSSGSPQSEPLNCQGAPSTAFPSCSTGWCLLWDLERLAA